MGLDHWLNRTIDIKSQYTHKRTRVVELEIEIDEVNKIELPKERVDSIKYELIDWRKSNHIHNWFVDNIQDGSDDCKSYYVSKESLMGFIEVLRKVEAIKQDVIKSNPGLTDEKLYQNIKSGQREELVKILPTQSGFFFGNSDYSYWYFEDVSSTLEILEKELKFIEDNPKLDINYEYGSSW